MQRILSAGHQAVTDYFYAKIKQLYCKEDGSIDYAVVDENNSNLLHWAIELRQSLPEVKSLIKQVNNGNGYDINCSDNKNTPLIYAVNTNNEELVKFLLAIPGIDPNQLCGPTNARMTPLAYAAFRHMNKAVDALLADDKVDVNGVISISPFLDSTETISPLLCAAQSNNQYAVRKLLAHPKSSVIGSTMVNFGVYHYVENFAKDVELENLIGLIHRIERYQIDKEKLDKLRLDQDALAFENNRTKLTVFGRDYLIPNEEFALFEALVAVVVDKKDPALLDKVKDQLETPEMRLFYRDPKFAITLNEVTFSIDSLKNITNKYSYHYVKYIARALRHNEVDALVNAINSNLIPHGFSVLVKALYDITKDDFIKLYNAIKGSSRVFDFYLPQYPVGMKNQINDHCAANRHASTYLKDNQVELLGRIKEALIGLGAEVQLARYFAGGIHPTGLRIAATVNHLAINMEFLDNDHKDEASFNAAFNSQLANLRGSITPKPAEQQSYLMKNQPWVLTMIKDCLQMIGAQELKEKITLNKKQERCLAVHFVLNNKNKSFIYSEADCVDLDSFLDDLLTDVAIAALNEKFNIKARIKVHGPETFDYSIWRNGFMGYLGVLNTFFNHKEMTYNPAAFDAFAKHVNAPLEGGNQKVSVVTSGMFADAKPTGWQPIPFPELVAKANELRQLAKPQFVARAS